MNPDLGKCSGRLRVFGSPQCQNKAVAEELNRPWCRRHLPRRSEKREAEKRGIVELEIAARISSLKRLIVKKVLEESPEGFVGLANDLRILLKPTDELKEQVYAQYQHDIRTT